MDQEKIGKFIKTKRGEKKLTQEELAKELGVNNKTVSRWETGKYMPDLSLFPMLSKVLGVSVNDLMSGEVVDKEDYQNTFEDNITTLVSEVDESNRKFNMIFYGVITLICCIVLFIIISVFITEYKFTIKYNDGLVNIKQDAERNLSYGIVNKYVRNTNYLIDSYENKDGEKIGLIFIKANQSISDMFNQEVDYENCVVADECVSLSGGKNISLNRYSVPKKYKVYYTTYSFKKIVKANDKELEKIINKSHLVYEHMNENTND